MDLLPVCPTQEMDTPRELDQPGIRGIGEQLDAFLRILEAKDDVIGSLGLINTGSLHRGMAVSIAYLEPQDRAPNVRQSLV